MAEAGGDLVPNRPQSDRQRDLPDQASENEQAAQAVALTLIRKEQATEADERGEGYSNLASSVHVSFPQHLQPMNLATHDRFWQAGSDHRRPNNCRGETRTKQE
jgi:hypothetical protein